MEKERICPWWMGWALLLPTRKLFNDPYKIFRSYIKPGVNIMDYGCAMGYFSIPFAKMTGSNGKVYCVDIQEKMLANLKKRALKYGVSDIIKPLQVGKDYNPDDLKEKLDFVLLFYVVHEVGDKQQLFRDIYSILKPGGKVFFAEPAGHVTPVDFDSSIKIALKEGLKVIDEMPLKKGLSVLLVK